MLLKELNIKGKDTNRGYEISSKESQCNQKAQHVKSKQLNSLLCCSFLAFTFKNHI